VSRKRGIFYKKINRRKDNCIRHILCRNCLLQHVIEGRIEERNGSDRKTREKN